MKQTIELGQDHFERGCRVGDGDLDRETDENRWDTVRFGNDKERKALQTSNSKSNSYFTCTTGNVEHDNECDIWSE